jgi:hypothetical protein
MGTERGGRKTDELADAVFGWHCSLVVTIQAIPVATYASVSETRRPPCCHLPAATSTSGVQSGARGIPRPPSLGRPVATETDWLPLILFGSMSPTGSAMFTFTTIPHVEHEAAKRLARYSSLLPKMILPFTRNIAKKKAKGAWNGGSMQDYCIGLLVIAPPADDGSVPQPGPLDYSEN